MKIITVHTYPPIPVRDFDWHAYLDGREEDGEYGSGRTEAEAIKDLISNWGDMFCLTCHSQIFAEDCRSIPDTRQDPGYLECRDCGDSNMIPMDEMDVNDE